MTRRKATRIDAYQQASQIKTRLLRTVKFGNPWSTQTLQRWKSEGRVFCIRWRGRDLYPAFQFGPCNFPWYSMKRILYYVHKESTRLAVAILV